jgi:uncharacterized membrane protein YciS (DUF1049 family)
MKLLNNNFIRFLVCFVSGMNLIFFLYSYNFLAAGVFILSAIVASFYSKYMVVILVVAMVVCNIACTRSQIDGFKKRSKMKKQNQNIEEGEPEGGSGTDSTLSQNITTILSDVKKIKKELTS